tara:strand:+ start:1485 stop:2072 length:588 start_codon:yes stop_codon:yes gene_type:complete
MITIGLTGSIGMGKTETSKIFLSYGIPVYDADKAVHNLYGPNKKGSLAIKNIFPNCINEDGSVNREILSKEVLDNKEKIKSLEQIIHPLVAEDRKIFFYENRNAKIIILDVPLLFETGGQKDVDYIIVVDAPDTVQKERVMARPNMTEEKFHKIISQQIPNHVKKQKADFIIDTSVSINHAKTQVKNIIEKINKR